MLPRRPVWIGTRERGRLARGVKTGLLRNYAPSEDFLGSPRGSWRETYEKEGFDDRRPRRSCRHCRVCTKGCAHYCCCGRHA